MLKLEEIKLNEENFKHFENRHPKPDWDDYRRFTSRETFEHELSAWQSFEDDVLFEGVKIAYDSGDLEYQHNPEFPVEIEIDGYKIESDIEADEISIYYNGFSFTLPFEKCTLADFVAACKICGIELKVKPEK